MCEALGVIAKTPSFCPVIVALAIYCFAAGAGCEGCWERPRSGEDDEGPRVVRPMKKAGTWYEADPDRLGEQIDRWIVAGATAAPPGRLVGLVSPHAGYRFSGPTAAHGYAMLGRERGVKRVIVMGVSHRVAFHGISLPEATHYQTPFGDLPLDPAVSSLRRSGAFLSLPEAHAEEHSVELQLPFIKRVRPGSRILPMLVGRADRAGLERAAAALAPLVDDHTVIVASSDFTHRGGHFRFEVPRQPGEPLKEAVRRMDMGTLPFIRKLDGPGLRAYHQRTGITMCGREPVALMLMTLKKAGVEATAKALHYTTSGDVTGTWRSTVSYLSVALLAPGGGGPR